MRTHRAHPKVSILLALLVLLATAWTTLAGAATADDTKPGAGNKKSAATVGIRPATSKGGSDDRASFEYEILPKGVQQDFVAVSNLRYKPITVRLYARDATYSEETPFSVQAADAKPTDLGSWIVLQTNRVTIPPRTEVVVPFQVGVPYNATPGDHAAGIMLSLLTRDPSTSGEPVVVDHRVGMRVHLRVPGDLKPALAVDDPKVDWDGGGNPLGKGTATVSYVVRNTGNIRMDVRNDINLTRMLGLPATEVDGGEIKDLLPGGTARITRTVRGVLGTGPMKAKIVLHGVPVDKALSDKKIDPVTEKGFSAWPWLLILEIVALLLLIGGGVYYERRRRELKAERRADELADAEARGRRASSSVLVRTALALGAAVALLVPGLGVPATAAQGDQWQATITKKEGIALEPFDLITSGGCPKPATSMVGFGYGKGFPKEGAVVVSNTDGGVTDERGFKAALVDSMKNIMALQTSPTRLQGTYKFVIRCIKAEFPNKSYGEYIAGIRFDKPDHWVALPPLTTEKGPIAQIPTTGPDGEPKVVDGYRSGGTATPGTGATDGAAGGPTASAGDASTRAGDLLGNDANSSGSGPNWIFVGAGIVIALAALLLVLGRRIPGPWRRS